MAIKLSINTGTTGSGATKWYALYTQRSTGKMADTTNSTWDTIVAGDLADYSSFLSEVSTSGVYEATVPAFVETAALTEPIDYVILATAAGTEAWTDGAIGKPRYQGTLTENANAVGISGSSTAADNLELAFTGATYNAAGLSVKTATDVETDTQDIQSRLPAALTAGGNIKADALALSGDTTAADNAESFFDGTGYAGTNNVIPLVTTTTTATNVTTVNGLAAGVITSTSIASDAITAAKIADDAIGASELAADAVSEIAAAISIPSAATIADAVWDEATTGHTTSGTFGEQVKTDIDAILDDTGTGGVIVVTNNDKTGYRLSATGVDDIWDETQSGHATAGTFGLYLDAAISSRLASASYTTPPTVGAIADQVWDEVRSGHTTGGTFGAGVTVANCASGSIGSGSFSAEAITAAALASDAVAEIQSGLSTLTAADVRTAVGLASANLDTQLADLPTVAELEARTLVAANYFDAGSDTVTVGAFNTAAKAELQQEATDALNAYDPPTNAEMEARTLLAASYFDWTTDQVIVATNNDKTGYALTTAYDVYHADIKLNIDDANSQDEYTITWFKNGVRVTSGITVPTLQVVKRSDGTDLIASTTPTQIASTGSYKHDATTTARMTAGQDALAIVTATIDGSSRTFATLVGRDSSA